MANNIINLRPLAATSIESVPVPALCNVLAFPNRVVPSRAKAARGRKPKRSNVLKFTGKKLRSIDGSACLPDWQKLMVEQLTKALGKVLRGELTGLMLATTWKFPTNDDNPEANTILCGTYSADLQLAAAQAQWIAEKAQRLAEDSTVRWV